MKRIVNLTPHILNIYNENDELVESIASSGIVTVKTSRKRSRLSLSFPVSIPIIESVTGLPGPETNTFYFVSGMVRAALRNRADLISPSTDRNMIVRDKEGKIIGLKEFDSNY